MVDVQKREDALLDQISIYRKNRDNTKAWLDMYSDAHLIAPEVAGHLWEVLMGIEVEQPA